MSEKELTPEQQKEQMQALIEQLQNSINPMDYMTPTQKEIAELSMEVLSAEYLLVEAKKSNRSSNQRNYVVSRYIFEQEKLKHAQDKLKENETTEVDTSNTAGDAGSNQA